MPDKTADWWKYTATAAVAALISLASAWVAIGNSACSRIEAHQIAVDQCVWNRDKGEVNGRIVSNEKVITSISMDVRGLTKEVAELITEIKISRRERELDRDRVREKNKPSGNP
jgi:hypothetical protein